MLQNKKGIIYFGNSDGVLEYDGFYWNTTGIPNKTPVRSLTESKSGRIYVGTVGEFGYLRNDKKGKMEYHSLLNNLTREERNFLDIYKAYSIGDTIYFATDDKLFRVLPNDKTSVFKHFSNSFNSYQVGSDIYIAGYDNKLYVLRNGKFQIVNLSNPSLNISSIRSMISLNKKEILLYINADKFYKLNKETNKIAIAEEFRALAGNLKEKYVYCSAQIEKDYFAFGTARGLFLYDTNSGKTRIIDTSTGLTDDGVYFMMVDRDKNLWVLNQMGINCVETSSPFTIFNLEQGLKGAPYSILRHNGTLYVATDYSTFYLENNRFKPVKGDISESWGLLSFKVNNKERKLLVGSSDGLFEIRKERAFPIFRNRVYLDLSQSFADSSILLAGLYETKSIALFQYKNRKWKQLESPSRLSNQSIKAIQIPSGQIWVNNYYKGYSTVLPDNKTPLKSRQVINFTDRSGLPHVSPYSLIYYYKGKMIFTNEYGLMRFNNRTNKFERDDAFGVNKVSKNKGVVFMCWDDEDNAAAAFLNHKETEIGVCTKIDSDKYVWDFVPFRKYSNADICTMYAEKDLVWLATTEGLVRYNRKKRKNYNTTFYTLLRKVFCHQDSVLYHGNETGLNITLNKPIGYDYNNLSFQVSSTFYERPKQTKYSFFLVGHSLKWSEWSTNNNKEFSNLHEGRYTLKVRSRNIYGVEGIPTSYTFEILPPLYRTTTAYFFYIIGTILLFSLLNFLNSKRLNNLNRKLEISIKKRTNEIMKKNKLLEVQKAEIHKQALELSHANETKDKFFSIIAHDLRSPFNAIIGFSTLLKECYDDFSEDERRGFVEEIDNSARKTLDMLNDLLTWARAQNKRIDITKEWLQLNHLTENVLHAMLPSAKRKNIELINLITVENRVYADKNTLNMVMTNLTNNAIKFTPDNGEVSVSAEENDFETMIHVKDNGIGISPENLEKIFRIDINFSTTGTHNETGTGLGLILCKEFIELNDGHLTVESTVGKGTTFTIHLPKE